MAAGELILLGLLLLGGSSGRKKKSAPKDSEDGEGAGVDETVPQDSLCPDPFNWSWDTKDGPPSKQGVVVFPYDGFTSEDVDFPIPGLDADDMKVVWTALAGMYSGDLVAIVPESNTFEKARKRVLDLQWATFGGLHVFWAWSRIRRGFVAFPCTDEEVAVWKHLSALVKQTSDAPALV